MQSFRIEVDVVPTVLVNPALCRSVSQYSKVHIRPSQPIFLGGPDVSTSNGYEVWSEFIWERPEEPIYAISSHGYVPTSILTIGLL